MSKRTIDWEKLRCPGLDGEGFECNNRILGWSGNGDPQMSKSWNDCCRKVFAHAKKVIEPEKLPEREIGVGRRRTINRKKTIEKPPWEQVKSRATKGICPLCGKYVGRGVVMHYRHCEGPDADLRASPDENPGGSEPRQSV